MAAVKKLISRLDYFIKELSKSRACAGEPNTTHCARDTVSHGRVATTSSEFCNVLLPIASLLSCRRAACNDAILHGLEGQVCSLAWRVHRRRASWLARRRPGTRLRVRAGSRPTTADDDVQRDPTAWPPPRSPSNTRRDAPRPPAAPDPPSTATTAAGRRVSDGAVARREDSTDGDGHATVGAGGAQSAFHFSSG